jgi:kynurenine formamidase
MNPEIIKRLINSGTVYDLGMEYYVGMPHHPNHPPFAFSLSKVHGDLMYEGGVSAANCVFTTGGHTGTHFDAHGHVTLNGKAYGIGDIEPWQDYTGLRKGGIEQVSPVVTRGVLLDVAAVEGVSCLGSDYRIGAEVLTRAESQQETPVERGDAVLVRTGWIQHYDEPRKYVSHHDGCPGLITDAGEWLVEKGAAYVGADTVALEKTPTTNLPVHVDLLVQNGIHIMEVLNLEELSAQQTYEFLFVALPLKIRGGTGSPIRPIAIA